MYSSSPRKVLVKILLTALFILASSALAQVKDLGFDKEVDDFTGERKCSHLTINLGEYTGLGVSIASLSTGNYQLALHRANLASEDLAHNMHGEMPGDRLYLRFGEGDVAEYPLTAANASFEEGSSQMQSSVGIEVDAAFLNRLAQAPADVRYRIASVTGETFEGTIIKEQLAPFASFVESCTAG